MMTSRFVVLAMQRTGSWHLVELLNQSGEVDCRGELLNPDDKSWVGSRLSLSTEELIEHAFAPKSVKYDKPDASAVGFKYLEGQDVDSGRPSFLEMLAKQKDIKAIVLRRSNPLESLRSQRQAELTSRWRPVKPGEKVSSRPTVVLTPEQCRSYFEKVDSYYKKVNELFADRPTIEVCHEDIVRDPQSVVRQLHDFLGVQGLDVAPSPNKRLESRPLSETVANYAALRSAFSGESWGAYFA